VPAGRRLTPALIFAVPLVAAAVGVLLALVLRDDGDGRPQRSGVARRRAEIAVGHARIAVPAGWESAGPRPIPGLGAGPGASLHRGAVDVSVAELAPSHPSLLPRPLADRIPAARLRPRVERVGALRAWRYDGLPGVHPARPLHGWVTPTTAGTLTVICESPAGALDPCRRALTGLRLAGASALALGADAALRERLPAVLAALNRRRGRARRDLARARSPRAASGAAERLSQAEIAAHAALLPLASVHGAGRFVVVRLGRLAFEYRGLAFALRAGDDRGVRAAAGAIGIEERHLAATLDRVGRR
jgi:hypothetical protein